MSERPFRRFMCKDCARNLVIELQLQGKRESLDYIDRHMVPCMHFRSRWDLLRYGLAQPPAGGLVAEFGVCEADSIQVIGEGAMRLAHGFDSFERLTEDWIGTTETAGKFNTGLASDRSSRPNDPVVRCRSLSPCQDSA